MNSFSNRLKKNLKVLQTWAQKFPCTAYRIYDRDIPEFAVSIDYYSGFLVIHRYTNLQFQERDEIHFQILFGELVNEFGFPAEKIFVKERSRQKGNAQYQKHAELGKRVEIQEGPLKFLVNLSDYLDTGLFLDHRYSRRWVREHSSGRRVLNLFCYTGAVSAHSIFGGASEVVSVDLSATYLDWAEENFVLNGFNPRKHPLVRADVLDFLKTLPIRDKFDLIFLDPPSFSNSKKMTDDFDVQKDHVWLVELCMSHLRPNGVLFFSNNLRSFKLDEDLKSRYQFQDVTQKTLPPDFKNKLIHRAWLVEDSRESLR